MSIKVVVAMMCRGQMLTNSNRVPRTRLRDGENVKQAVARLVNRFAMTKWVCQTDHEPRGAVVQLDVKASDTPLAHGDWLPFNEALTHMEPQYRKMLFGPTA